jgi:hypothetical protein
VLASAKVKHDIIQDGRITTNEALIGAYADQQVGARAAALLSIARRPPNVLVRFLISSFIAGVRAMPV